MGSRLNNNFFTSPTTPGSSWQAGRRPQSVVAGSPDEGDDDGPDAVSVPEGPAWGSGEGNLLQRRAQLRSAQGQRSSASSSASASPRVFNDRSGSSDVSTATAAVTSSLHAMTLRQGQDADARSSPVAVVSATPPSGRGRRAAPMANARPVSPPDKPTTPQRYAEPPLLSKPAPGGPTCSPAASKPRSAAAAAWGGVLVEDVVDDELLAQEPGDTIPVPWGGVRSNAGACAPPSRPGTASLRGPKGSPLAPDTARALRALLWGTENQPPGSWKQGLFFSTQRGLRYGLVQVEGGPCGIIAAVQAHVLADLRTQGGAINIEPSPAQQRAALVAALADIVWQARLGQVASIAMASAEGGAPVASMSHDALMRGITLHQADSRHQLEELLGSCSGAYMEPRGWGLLLLLVSVLVSRGVDAVRADMDDPTGGCLMGLHGYCTQELVNLLIMGQAASNVFDGQKDLDGSILKGVTRRCRVGLLTLFEWYQYCEVGRSLKSPDLPIWVVCSESHFTILFSQDGHALGGSLPIDLLYYDQLASQQEPIRLTVSHDPDGGWTARVGATIGDRGKCEGHNIPPLECVIETRWPGVRVDWNGTDPIL